MKITSGVFAVLLLVTAMAVGQQHASYAEPFPQSANPALANGTAEELSLSGIAEAPSSMAAIQSSTSEVMLTSFSDQRDKAGLGSPFPSAANPSLANGSAGELMGHSTVDEGSLFPSFANPSNYR
jgi:hypothetical protein